MQLPVPFIRLPLSVDAERLRTEIAQIPISDWRPHPQGHPGNTALPLIARNGRADDDGVAGPMRPAPHLARLPYLRQVLSALAAPLGRTRLMRLDAGAEATAHVDTNYYWLQRTRVHIPVQTTPGVRFLCGDAATHMAAGEVWIFDTWRPHNVINPPGTERIHLVADTVGSDAFWELARSSNATARTVDFHLGADPSLQFEAVNFPVVMSPWEFDAIWSSWCTDARIGNAAPARVDAMDAEVRHVLADWRALWARHGDAPDGWNSFRTALDSLRAIAARHAGAVLLPNRQDLAQLLTITLIPALHEPAAGARRGSAAPDLGQVAAGDARPPHPPGVAPRRAETPVAFERPLIIVCTPRSGSSLVFERLAECSPEWVTVGNESHAQIEGISALQPRNRGDDSNVLEAVDATPEIAAEVRARFAGAARDRDGRSAPAAAPPLRLLEKTPKNALRISFLDKVFPDARYLYLWREPEESLASLIEGWQSGRFVMYPDLPGWPGPPWSYLLVPGWRKLAGRPLADIVAAQWRSAQEKVLDDLAALPADRVRALSLTQFLADPSTSLAAICRFAGVAMDRPPPPELPLSAHTVSAPRPDKWRRHEREIAPLLPSLAPVVVRAREFVAAHRLGDAAPSHPTTRTTMESRMPDPSKPAPAAATAPAPAASRESPSELFASVHTTNLPAMLTQLGASLVITTYQTGHVIIARPDGATVNTHFAAMRKPMGVATDQARIVIGTETGVREYRNVPALSPRVDPPGRHDAVYVLRNQHITGDIDIHEIALAGADCWYVNTRFSCLCTLDNDHSFVPRWRPRFVTALAPEDRCHLNGLAVVDGTPRFLTALGATDTPEGWRTNKKDGGVILDYATGEIAARGLSMPHSPRWHNGRLWVLESGRGSLGTVDLKTGRVDTVARVPGFTRGLDLVGPLAFIGLSQLRETNAFTDIPITEENNDRMSGVWVVNIENGETVAFLKFSRQVQEIFGVVLLRGAVFPVLLDDDSDLLKSTYVLPDAALKEVRFASTPPLAKSRASS